ncbi:ORF_114 [Adoxophyes orana granulovirus]|uniref:ADOR115 n=1 Tax=Adoxophyes orana granulovirus TaxID=170617 RepID=Q7T9Q1_GVAO|nr:ORF_114 [Adoxophyes orana granulovirus]AAP85751.1 ORF_114 [Adoxophyes orana granulovirus]AJA91755.1 ADOR115 [Adoxophyes orana granulovirus]
MSSINNKLIKFVNNTDKAISDQFVYVEKKDNLYTYTNKNNDNIVYFPEPLINNPPQDDYDCIIYY